MRLSRRTVKRARIEIIPMIDTIFFLLVFFMISIPTTRRCSLAVFSMQACAFSTFAIHTIRKRSRTGSRRLAGRLSFPQQVAGQRALIERWIRLAHWARWRKHGRELHLWTVSDGNGFQILRFTKPIHELLGKDDEDDN
jgi:hypothetical protein